MFRCRACDVLHQEVVSLRAQLSDQSDLILRLIKEHAEERKLLLDRVLAVQTPAALREVQRSERPERVPGPPPRPNFPGFRRDLRPPTPIGTQALSGATQGFINPSE
jgi:hypothetical protein